MHNSNAMDFDFLLGANSKRPHYRCPKERNEYAPLHANISHTLINLVQG